MPVTKHVISESITMSMQGGRYLFCSIYDSFSILLSISKTRFFPFILGMLFCFNEQIINPARKLDFGNDI